MQRAASGSPKGGTFYLILDLNHDEFAYSS